jgi:hypothetical protein
MKNNLLTEITDFKNDVKHNGMVINTYLNKRKEFLQRIELSSDRSLQFFRILYFNNLITKEQYIDFKMRIANARKYYKRVLSFY